MSETFQLLTIKKFYEINLKALAVKKNVPKYKMKNVKYFNLFDRTIPPMYSMWQHGEQFSM